MATIERAVAQVMTAVYGLKHGEKGQGMVEYGLILALVAVVVIAALTTIGTGINNDFQKIASAV